MEPRWFSTKESLLTEARKSCSSLFLLSKDYEPESAKKRFAFFKNSNSLIDYANSTKNNNPHLYEIIPDDMNYPVYMFFDIDRNIQKDDEYFMYNRERTVSIMLLSVLSRFLKNVYKIDYNLESWGKNVQVCTAPSDTKLSAHVKIDIVVKNMATLKQVINQFIVYILNDKFITDHERDALIFKDNQSDSKTKTCIDTAVYTNFRSFRLLYSSKWKTGGIPFTPLRSSTKIEDHLVNAHENLRKQSQPFISELSEFDFTTGMSTENTISITKQIASTSLSQNDNANQIPVNILDEIKKMLPNMPFVKKNLKTETFMWNENSALPVYPHTHCFYFKGYFCPYAKRFHRNNRSYLQYNHLKKTISYKCFNKECREVEHNQGLLSEKLTFANELDTPKNRYNIPDTLHYKQNVISWDQHYNQEIMNPYPLTPICAIRANMGTGKTVALTTKLLPQVCTENPDVSILFITYQRLLAMKYYNELKQFDFENYMDIQTRFIYNKRVIVCLDSLTRIKTHTFDYIIIDEAHSVFLHFNSSMMKNPKMISMFLETLLINAKHTYFLDACVDSVIVHDVITHISNIRNVKPYYIRNAYVRPTNRHCYVTENTSGNFKTALKQSAFDKIESLIKQNKRIVITASTKAFAVDAEDIIQTYLQQNHITKKILLYHSESTDKVTSENIEYMEENWLDCDILIYSPTITAGVSFTPLHFDALVAYMENTYHTPPVDTTVQQLFRVRQLRDGDMFLFINNVFNQKLIYKYPTTPLGVDEMLTREANTIGNYYTDIIENFSLDYQITQDGGNENQIMLSFDKTKFAYKILRGILVNNNTSKLNYFQLLQNTLIQDYNVKYTQIPLNTTEDFIDIAQTIQQSLFAFRELDNIIYTFSHSLYLTPENMEMLEKMSAQGIALTHYQKTQVWVTKCVNEIWRIPFSLLDKYFYNHFILSDRRQKNVYDLYYSYIRCHQMLTRTLTENKMVFTTKMRVQNTEGDNTHELYNEIRFNHYQTLCEAQEFVEQVIVPLHPNFKDSIKNGQIVSINIDAFHESIKKYLRGMSGERYNRFLSAHEIGQPGFLLEPKGPVKNASSKRCKLSKKILSKSFGINMISFKYGTRERKYLFDSFYNKMTYHYRSSIVKRWEAETTPSLNEEDEYYFEP